MCDSNLVCSPNRLFTQACMHHDRRLGMIFYALLCMLIALFGVSPVAHAAEDATLRVNVNATGTSAIDAKRKALAKAEKEAVTRQLTRMDASAAPHILKTLNAQDVDALINKRDVVNEQARVGSYTALIVYHFNMQRLQALVDEANGIAPGVQADSVLVIPLYQLGQELRLWHNNDWRNALNIATLEVGKGSVVMPFGDRKDTQMLNEIVLRSQNADILKRVATRYGAAGAVLALAEPIYTDGVLAYIQVSLQRPGVSRAQATSFRYKPLQNNESEGAILTRAAQETAAYLAEHAGRFMLGKGAERANRMIQPVTIRYTGMRGYQNMRDALHGLPGVEQVVLRALNASESQVMLVYRGSSAALLEALQLRGLQVQDNAAKIWVVKL